MIDIIFWEYAKKVNSTAQPEMSGTTFACTIKEPCTMINPIIKLNRNSILAPNSNYAYIEEFRRYYFIRNWKFEESLWVAEMEVDVLASWKNQLGALSCYILRSSSDYNGAILDTTYPGINTTSLQESQSSDSPWHTDDVTDGMFVVGVAGQSTTYYLFTYAGLDAFFEYLFSDLYAAALTDEWSTVFPQLKAQTNPLQYITQVLWIPFLTTGTDVSSIRVGWVDVPAAAWRVDGSGIRAGQSDFSLRRHPQSDRGSYLNNAPHSNYMLFYPPWGTIPLDPDTCANSNVISAIWLVDLKTGQGTLTVSAGDGETTQHVMSWVHSQVGVHYQVSQVVNKGFGLANMLMPVVSAGSMALTGNYMAAGVSAAGSASSLIGNFAASKIPSATTIGSNGGVNALRGIPALQYEFKHVTAEDNARRGKPLCEVRRVDSLDGFMVVANANVSIAATKEEQDSIKAYMEGGFFYE